MAIMGAIVLGSFVGVTTKSASSIFQSCWLVRPKIPGWNALIFFHKGLFYQIPANTSWEAWNIVNRFLGYISEHCPCLWQGRYKMDTVKFVKDLLQKRKKTFGLHQFIRMSVLIMEMRLTNSLQAKKGVEKLFMIKVRYLATL